MELDVETPEGTEGSISIETSICSAGAEAELVEKSGGRGNGLNIKVDASHKSIEFGPVPGGSWKLYMQCT